MSGFMVYPSVQASSVPSTALSCHHYRYLPALGCRSLASYRQKQGTSYDRGIRTRRESDSDVKARSQSQIEFHLVRAALPEVQGSAYRTYHMHRSMAITVSA